MGRVLGSNVLGGLLGPEELTGEPKLWPTSWAKVMWETLGGTWEP